MKTRRRVIPGNISEKVGYIWCDWVFWETDPCCFIIRLVCKALGLVARCWYDLLRCLNSFESYVVQENIGGPGVLGIKNNKIRQVLSIDSPCHNSIIELKNYQRVRLSSSSYPLLLPCWYVQHLSWQSQEITTTCLHGARQLTGLNCMAALPPGNRWQQTLAIGKKYLTRLYK